ncbi:uncharacterized protein LOC125036848 [Penaeus chinensis]|uniref:uncharacterized protein LOC125036848 n=1 Tax=Penaeus chinensis TaxID=139456 RepID=UPI001FB619B9|nr:uncharacterized protein LOC125036848 [Penaeus chinensis]
MSPVKVRMRRLFLLVTGSLLLGAILFVIDSDLGSALGLSEYGQMDDMLEENYYEIDRDDAAGEFDFEDVNSQNIVAETGNADAGVSESNATEAAGNDQIAEVTEAKEINDVKNAFIVEVNKEPELKKQFEMERFNVPKQERAQPFGQWQPGGRRKSGFGAAFAPKKETSCTVPALKSIPQFIHQVSDLEAKCNELRTFGTPPRGKDLCLDDKYKIKSGNCVVFSFGINYDWSFEDDMGKFGCMVYAYDPTMGKTDHQRSENIHFFATGISNYKGTKLLRLNNRVFMSRVDRFVNFLRAAGLEGEEIDVIKLDTEMSQVDFLQDLLFNSRHLLKKIKQITMTVYTDVVEKSLSQGGFFQLLWPYLQMMKCAGFKVISSNRSRRGREVVWAQDKEW